MCRDCVFRRNESVIHNNEEINIVCLRKHCDNHIEYGATYNFSYKQIAIVIKLLEK